MYTHTQTKHAGSHMHSPSHTHTHTHTHTHCSPAQPHTLLTSSPCGLVKRQFAACSKAELRVAAVSQVTNWQGCFPLPLIVGAGVFHRRRVTLSEGPGLRWSVNERDVMATLLRSSPFRLCFLIPSLPASVCVRLVLFILPLSPRATSHIINLLHSPPSPLIYAVTVLPLLSGFFLFVFLYSENKIRQPSESKFALSFDSTEEEVRQVDSKCLCSFSFATIYIYICMYVCCLFKCPAKSNISIRDVQ